MDALVIANIKTQINYYYDTYNKKLFNNCITLRIRQKNAKLFLQYKYDKNFNGLVNTCIEYEKNISEFPMSISGEMLPEEEKCIYHYVGNMTTNRRNYEIDDVVISLDVNYYLGVVDYELEIEFKEIEKAKKIISQNFVNDLKINNVGKYQRFVKRIYFLERG